ncbi:MULTISPECIES: transposase [unclassified Nonomuraea]|uniref:transposase n=1 Tax=unclassified Nonomuraea TaxID=2593643 RepID=UPI00207BC692|nr:MULTISPECIES: transposase [unclassified Nonomuraea]
MHSRPSPLYFGIGKRPRGTTWLNTVSDKVMGLGGLAVPGTMRDSMYILDATHRFDATEPPDIVTIDTGSYSDVVYGMFAFCGYQFAPRHADITDTQLWWVDSAMLRGEITRDHRGSNGVRRVQRAAVAPGVGPGDRPVLGRHGPSRRLVVDEQGPRLRPDQEDDG